MSYENFKKDAQYFARFLDTVGMVQGTSMRMFSVHRIHGALCSKELD